MDKHSLQAYEKILHTLPQRRKDVLREVIVWPGRTAQEITHDAHLPGAWKRLSELEKLGHVERGEPRECSYTKHVAATWYPKEIWDDA